VINWDLMLEGCDVGDQPAVTSPPQRLAAHDHRMVGLDKREQVRDSGSEFVGSCVRRVRPKRGVSPPGIKNHGTSRKMAAAAQPFVPSVLNPRLGQPLLQSVAPNIGITPAARIAAYVENDIDSRVLEKSAERGLIQVPVSDGQQGQHPSIMPSGSRVRRAAWHPQGQHVSHLEMAYACLVG
jgi:hypothetical protein